MLVFVKLAVNDSNDYHNLTQVRDFCEEGNGNKNFLFLSLIRILIVIYENSMDNTAVNNGWKVLWMLKNIV